MDIFIPDPVRAYINTIRVDKTNPNVMPPEKFEALKKNIQKYGFIVPIITNIDGVIADGFHRWKAARELGMTEVLVIKLPIKEVDRRMLRQILNKLKGSHDAGMDKDEFEFIMQEGDFDEFMELLPEADYDTIVGELNDDVEVQEVDAEPAEGIKTDIKVGDMFKLGEHRLRCGDSTKEEDVNKLMGGDKADMVFTDPPYGMFLNTDNTSLAWGNRKGKKYDKVIGDNEDFKPELITTIFNNFGYCEEIFLWGADYYYPHIIDFDKGHYLVWDKTLQSNGDAGSNSEFELLWTKKKHKRQVIHFNWFRYFGLSSQDIKTREHPTQKPLQVCLPFIEKYSKEGQTIIDLFGGSGSTLIACEQLNRKCYMMELDPSYCQVIINRWEKLTGKKAEKI